MDKNEIEIPFGSNDSELVESIYHIPDGMEAIIEGDKVIIRKKESEDEKIRKALIEYFSIGANNNETTCNIEDKKILAWLESIK